MLEFLTKNFTYVIYRLLVTAHIIMFFDIWFNYYIAVIIAAQISYYYDNIILGWFWSKQQLPDWRKFLRGQFYYTLRVIAAWFVIKILWDITGNYYIAVFIGAELTYIIDNYLIKWVWKK